MAMNYNRLWKLLIDKKMMKTDLIKLSGISTNAMAKMGKGGDVSTQVLAKVCKALDCKIEDIVEVDFSDDIKKMEGVNNEFKCKCKRESSLNMGDSR